MTLKQITPSLTVLQRCDQFVGRTVNWLYDHLRYVPRHKSLVLADRLENRQEFPLIEARSRDWERFSRRIWRRLMGDRLYPTEATWIRQHHPALLHSHFGYVAIGDFGLRAILGLPWVVSFYGADVYELGHLELWRESYDRLFQQSNLVLALGPQMAARLQLLGCPKDKIAVHPLGVDVEALPNRQRVLQRGVCEILFAGTFREKKGIEYVIRGVAKARQRGVRLHLTLVGDAAAKSGDLETKQSVFREIDKLDLKDVVTHRPFVQFDELIQIALRSHVFIAPSVTSVDGDAEGTPFVLQQMMATGMPVIATVHSDIPYVFGEYKHKLVPERDADAIAQRIQEYADDPDLLIHDGTAFRDRIRCAFDVRSCANQLAQLYDVIGEGRNISHKRRMETVNSISVRPTG